MQTKEFITVDNTLSGRTYIGKEIHSTAELPKKALLLWVDCLHKDNGQQIGECDVYVVNNPKGNKFYIKLRYWTMDRHLEYDERYVK